MTNIANHPSSPGLDPQSPGKSEGSTVQKRKPQMFLKSVAVITQARQELAALTGYEVDSVSGFEKTNEGWRLTVTVVEVHRIPATTDVLATYEVTLNEAGDVINYHRTNRYFRNQVGGDQ